MSYLDNAGDKSNEKMYAVVNQKTIFGYGISHRIHFLHRSLDKGKWKISGVRTAIF